MKAALIELLGIVLYLIFLQYVLAVFVFERPNEAWALIGWRWLATRRDAWWDANVAPTYNQPGSAEEPEP